MLYYLEWKKNTIKFFLSFSFFFKFKLLVKMEKLNLIHVVLNYLYGTHFEPCLVNEKKTKIYD